MSNNLVAAIDIGSLNNYIIFMNKENDHVYLELKKLSNNLPGINHLWEEATRLLKECNLDGIDSVMESSDPYWLQQFSVKGQFSPRYCFRYLSWLYSFVLSLLNSRWMQKTWPM